MRKDLEEWESQQWKIIAELYRSFKKDFLTVCFVYVEPIKLLVPVGIFKCRKCGKPISHQQYLFSGLCGNCDIGREMKKWIIKKPEDYELDNKTKKKLIIHSL